MKIRQVKDKLFFSCEETDGHIQTDRQTKRHDEANSCLSLTRIESIQGVPGGMCHTSGKCSLC